MGSQGLELRSRHNKWITLAPDISRMKSNKAISSWNVRTMCLGLSSDLQQIDDSWKTAIIDNELTFQTQYQYRSPSRNQAFLKRIATRGKLHFILEKKGARRSTPTRRWLCSLQQTQVSHQAAAAWYHENMRGIVSVEGPISNPSPTKSSVNRALS